jgi:hypothetical protein
VEIQFSVTGNLAGHKVVITRTRSTAIIVNGQTHLGSGPDGPAERNMQLNVVNGKVYSVDMLGWARVPCCFIFGRDVFMRALGKDFPRYHRKLDVRIYYSLLYGICKYWTCYFTNSNTRRNIFAANYTEFIIDFKKNGF